MDPLVISAIAFLLVLYLIRDQLSFIDRSQFMLLPLFMLSVFAICLSSITVNKPLPLSRPLGFLGCYSYSLYLFHWHYYTLLAMAGLIVEDHGDGSISAGRLVLGACIAILVSPAFLAVCVLLQKAADRVSILLSPGRQKPVHTPIH